MSVRKAVLVATTTTVDARTLKMIPESPLRAQFAGLYRSHYDAVLGYTLAHATLEVAKEATSDTFLVAWRRFEDIPEVPLPWLIGIARRCLSGLRRSERRRGALMVRLELVHSDVCADVGVAVVERDLVLRALARLRGNERDVLLLIAMANLSPEEAAIALGCSRGTFDVRLHRARVRFAAALCEEDHPAVGAAVTPLRAARKSGRPGDGGRQ
ncbi:MAG: RNA polymerase sigma factor [Acidimicrobiales bacterium]